MKYMLVILLALVVLAGCGDNGDMDTRGYGVKVAGKDGSVGTLGNTADKHTGKGVYYGWINYFGCGFSDDGDHYVDIKLSDPRD